MKTNNARIYVKADLISGRTKNLLALLNDATAEMCWAKDQEALEEIAKKIYYITARLRLINEDAELIMQLAEEKEE